MDSVIELIHELMPALCIIALLAFAFKTVLVFSYKGFDIPALIVSFFRLYGSAEKEMASQKKRVNYMKLNNYINYYFYIFSFLFILMLVIFKKKIFVD
jgi:hypothetical protein